MNISKTHKYFANLLEFRYHVPKQDVLNHPEKYLGPNWEVVINFWLYLDTLTEDKLKVVGRRYMALSRKSRDIALGRAYDGAKSTTNIKYAYIATSAAYGSVSCAKGVADFGTLELIGLDNLLKQGYQPFFFPLFMK